MLDKIDLGKAAKVAEKIDLNILMDFVLNMDPKMMQMLMSQMGGGKSNGANGKKKELPAPNLDFYNVAEFLTPEQQAIQMKVRKFMEDEINPIANEYWAKDEFPHQILPKVADLGLIGLAYKGYGCLGQTTLLEGICAMEMARVDSSFATFFGVHGGLAMGSIYFCGSEEQKQKWLPPMQRMEKIGCFGLTEPEVGSGTAGGMNTTCRREGDTWILNGKKKWIGNGTFADVAVIWAREESTGNVKGFLVEKDTPGFSSKKIEGKIALRIVQNAILKLENVKVHEENRLQEANTFADTAKVLRMTRAGVAWMAVGCALGAYENSLKYAQNRKQFGKAIGNFQLVQNLLVQMYSNITACQTLCTRLSQMQDAGVMKDEHASMAKAFCTLRMRETVGWARELFGGNGILLDHNVGRFVADAEAIYSYEGTREMNTLIVGRAITGFSAFV
ncbi:MAG: acyl-CoA dehydrogenase family protein [Ignavibacteria bacterium]|nr:acyl-CoA dehydrogenase family protein [Ignavibacteria bacterium]MBL7993240.1 acyl-CoA dehydrogenase family protein [Candidatus Kapabacteria bacterium]